MNFSRHAAYWAFLVVFFSILIVYQQLRELLQLDGLTYLLLAGLIMLLFLPLASEIEVFNVFRIRKEFSQLKESVEHKLNIIQNAVTTNVLANAQQQAQTINFIVEGKVEGFKVQKLEKPKKALHE